MLFWCFFFTCLFVLVPFIKKEHTCFLSLYVVFFLKIVCISISRNLCCVSLTHLLRSYQLVVKIIVASQCVWKWTNVRSLFDFVF